MNRPGPPAEEILRRLENAGDQDNSVASVILADDKRMAGLDAPRLDYRLAGFHPLGNGGASRLNEYPR